jgi:hypothetical protein
MPSVKETIDRTVKADPIVEPHRQVFGSCTDKPSKRSMGGASSANKSDCSTPETMVSIFLEGVVIGCLWPNTWQE